MDTVVVLDRYTNKYLKVGNIPPVEFALIKVGDKLVYGLPDPKTGIVKNSVGIVIENKALNGIGTLGGGMKSASEMAEKNFSEGTGSKDWLTGSYERMLQGDEKVDFDEQQDIALKIFPTFKKEFQTEYPNSVPITARFQVFSNQLYFFFYSEERYVFTEFVKRFREKLGMNMFLFQIGARDMMRMSPGAEGMCGSCGHTLCCKSNMLLPNIEIEAVILQNLEGRDIERLKGKCGKLKCCLVYELEVYIKESKKYPAKGTKIDTCKLTNHCKDGTCKTEECQGVVTSFNIITQEVSIKTKDGLLRIPLEKLRTAKI